MKVSQRVIRARTHPENTAKLYDILANYDKSDNGSVSQRVIKTRTRADGKAKGIAIRRK